VTGSLTTALEEMTLNNEQLSSKIRALKDENKQLTILMVRWLFIVEHYIQQIISQISEISGLKDEKKQLTTLLDNMVVNNENQIQQINSQSSEIDTLKDENKQLKTEVQQLKVGHWSWITWVLHIHYPNHSHINHTIFIWSL